MLVALCVGLFALPPSAGAHAHHSRPVLFTANSVAGTVTLIDARTLKKLGRINIIPDGDTPRDPAQAAIYPFLVKEEGVNYAQGIAISPNGRVLYVSRGYLGDVAAFRISTGKELWRLQTDSLRADHVALSPNGRRLFVSALTANKVQVIDTETRRVVRTLEPGRAILHLEFTPRGEAVWISARDDDRVLIYDTATLAQTATLPIDGPSGIFFTSRAARVGF